MNLLKIKILTPNGIYLEDDIYRLDVRTQSGNMGILHNHSPLVSSLDIAKMQIITKDQKPKIYALHGGLLNVIGKEAVIITSAIESQEAIDKKRAQIAKDNAEKIITKTSKEDRNYLSAELALKRAITRLKL